MAKRRKVADGARMQNAAKSLLANIRFASIDKQVRSLAITSSVPNEGKTTVAIALAQAAASMGERVLLVECDMRRRSLANQLGVHSRAGLHAVVCGQVDLSEAVATTSTRGLHFLDAEPHIPNPEAVFNSRRFSAFLEHASSAYRYVIFDTPPLSAFVDAAVLSTIVDGTLLVVGENVVRRDELVAAYDQLEKAHANILGAVTNLSSGGDSDYYSHYYDNPNEDAPVDASPASSSTLLRDESLDSSSSNGFSKPESAGQPLRPVRPAPAVQPQGSLSPDSTAQFMVGRYNTTANSQSSPR